MQKDFDVWNKQKKSLELSSKTLIYKTGQVWWCYIGVNLKSESCGKGQFYARPVLILKKLTKDLCLIIPATTKSKHGTWFFECEVASKKATFQLHQVRLISTIRLIRQIDFIPNKVLKKIKKQLQLILN